MEHKNYFEGKIERKKDTLQEAIQKSLSENFIGDCPNCGNPMSGSRCSTCAG